MRRPLPIFSDRGTDVAQEVDDPPYRRSRRTPPGGAKDETTLAMIAVQGRSVDEIRARRGNDEAARSQEDRIRTQGATRTGSRRDIAHARLDQERA